MVIFLIKSGFQLFFWLYLAVALFVCTIVYWPPEPTLAPVWYVLLFSPRWWAWFVCLAAIPGFFLRGWVVRLLFLGLTTMQLFAFQGFRLHPQAFFEEGSPVLALATFNVGNQPVPAALFRSWLDASGLELVFLQECVLEDRLEGVFPETWSVLREDRLVVASRFPLRLEKTQARGELTGGYGLVFLQARLSLGGEDWTLFNVHLETPRSGLEPLLYRDLDLEAMRSNFRRREYEARVLAEAVPPESRFILAGDFNMTQESPLYRHNFGSWSNAFSRAGRGFGHTKFTSWHGTRIDHIVVPKSVSVIRAAGGPDFGSDHLPVIALLGLD